MPRNRRWIGIPHFPYIELDMLIKLRRQDEALGAERIPDPTTAGDFCRRFEPQHLRALQQAYDVARRKVWSQQPPEFFAEARIEADGTFVGTDAECKQGIDIN